MENAIKNLQQRVEDKFIAKYQDFVSSNIVIFRDDPCVKRQRPVTMPSQDLFEQIDENLISEKNALYKEYVAKQQKLRKINRETVQLQHEFNHTLKAINDNYQSMKRAAAEEHDLLLQQCQGIKDQFPIGPDHQQGAESAPTTDSCVSMSVQSVNDSLISGPLMLTGLPTKMPDVWPDKEISAVLP